MVSDIPTPLSAYVVPPNLLAGRVVAITGAGAGIGRALAIACAEAGATVVLMGRTVRKLESTYDALEALGAPEPAIFPVELAGATVNDYDQLTTTLNDTFGRLDGIVHNAGILGTRSPIELYDEQQWAEVMQVNVNATFYLTRSLLPLLRKTENASVIFTSSGVGRRGRAYWGAYAVSKFAIEGFAQVLADELEDSSSVRVNVLNPGAVRTGMRANAYPAEDPRTLPKPEAITPAYLYLLGPDSVGVHGQSLDAQAPKP
ncbi:MAG: YciK family oxidoreductase [Pseudomonadota bacterium]